MRAKARRENHYTGATPRIFPQLKNYMDVISYHFQIKPPARMRAKARRENHCTGTTPKIFPQLKNYMDVIF
jgi:hypothetical protein